jgi:hypothetical protein
MTVAPLNMAKALGKPSLLSSLGLKRKLGYIRTESITYQYI